MITVKYGKNYLKSKYKVNLKNKIKIEYLKFLLRIKRMKRFIKRITVNNVVNIVSLIFIIFVTVCVTYLGMYLKEYNNFFEGIWDMKDLLISNVMLIIFVTIYTSETEWHKNLLKQYDIYYSLMCESEWYINELLSIIDYRFINSIYIDENNYDIFHENVSKIKISKTLKINKKLETELIDLKKSI